MAPAGTPPAIIARLNAETTKILALPEVRATLLAQAALPVGSTPDQFRSYIAEEIDRWGKVIKLTGARDVAKHAAESAAGEVSKSAARVKMLRGFLIV